MHSNKLKQLAEQAQKSNDKYYAWLRWLVLLCAGFFSIMVGQLTGKPFLLMQLWVLKAALGLTAMGILGGSIALYGEVVVQRKQVLNLRHSLLEKLQAAGLPNASNGAPVAASPDKIHVWSEKVCYTSLIIALLAWVLFVWMV